MTAAVSPAETSDIDIGRLTALADVMLPAAHGMPAVSDVEAVESYLAQVLGWRDDLRQPLVRAVDALDPTSFTVDRLMAFHEEDEDAYVALTSAVAACYYFSPVVRELIGYPGQVAKTYDPYAYTEWVAEGLLDPVVERGPIWREAPE
ncbi:MAG: hypothetical protein F4Z06_01925 [Acidimicrobiia bacterium]|nr:hypothetical protein [Acidimicrobiia bacterium]MYE73591.1 hypothetical protein [Acidimicrobiia bacterium]MYJ61852.1 hypothetical protein [Acidimicrobiia bacterium]